MRCWHLGHLSTTDMLRCQKPLYSAKYRPLSLSTQSREISQKTLLQSPLSTSLSPWSSTSSSSPSSSPISPCSHESWYKQLLCSKPRPCHSSPGQRNIIRSFPFLLKIENKSTNLRWDQLVPDVVNGEKGMASLSLSSNHLMLPESMIEISRSFSRAFTWIGCPWLAPPTQTLPSSPFLSSPQFCWMVVKVLANKQNGVVAKIVSFVEQFLLPLPSVASFLHVAIHSDCYVMLHFSVLLFF